MKSSIIRSSPSSNNKYDGTGKYSNRFSAVVEATTISEALDEIFVFTSVDPVTSLSLNPSSVREKGDTLTSIILTSTNTLGQNPTGTLTELIFKRGGTVLDTIVNPSSSEQYEELVDITDTTTFTTELTDSESRTDGSSKTITFLYPLLYMVGAASLTPAQIYSGSTSILSASENRTISFSPSNQVCYYAIPASEGAFSSILDENGFETIGDWTRRNENITGLDGNPVAYYIYEFNNLTTQTNFEYTFS